MKCFIIGYKQMLMTMVMVMIMMVMMMMEMVIMVMVMVMVIMMTCVPFFYNICYNQPVIPI